MLTRELTADEQQLHNRYAKHPLQSWEWGVFREKLGITVRRFGTFDDSNLRRVFQVFFHQVPKTAFTVGYIPRGPLPDAEMLAHLQRIGAEHNAIFIKMEPNVLTTDPRLRQNGAFSAGDFARQFAKLHVAKKELFTNHTFQIDLTKTEEELMRQMQQKTRYNVRVAQKKGVRVTQEHSPEMFETYLRLTAQTLKRQKFYAHNQQYHRQLWETLQPAGIAHLLVARYKEKVLATWILLLFNNILYYPYGASSNEHRELMASNLMVWEAMRWGKQHNAVEFDLWGALGANPDTKHRWYGFHRFKEGFGGKHVEFIGSYDYVLKPRLYPLYNVAEKLRWLYLHGATLLWSIPKLW